MTPAIGLAALILVSADAASPRVLSAPRALAQAQAQAVREVVVDVKVHGNQIVSDEDVLQIAGITTGTPFTETLLKDAERRLKASGKFETVEVIKRFASIEDLSRVLVVIIVNEGPVRIVVPGVTGALPILQRRSFLSNLMFAPVIEGSDGYGLTFGARVAYPRILGDNSRLSVPLTLGGVWRAGVEVDKAFARGPFTRVEFGGAMQRRNNPAFDVGDVRRVLYVRGQRSMGIVRAGMSAGWQNVTFAELDDTYRTIGADVTIDTRTDTALPRTALVLTASVERVFMDRGPTIDRTRIDGKAFLGIWREYVLMIHVVHENASTAVPPYFRPILGGYSTLRGFQTGFLTGDTLAAASIELRIPLTSPMNIGKLGLSVFSDWGTAYERRQHFRDQPIYNGVGGTVWYAVASFRISMAVAYGQRAGTRVHFSGGIGF
jgi:outer membrane protein assembly factor BamA